MIKRKKRNIEFIKTTIFMFFQIDQSTINKKKKENEQNNKQTTCFNFFKIMTFSKKDQYFFKTE